MVRNLESCSKQIEQTQHLWSTFTKIACHIVLHAQNKFDRNNFFSFVFSMGKCAFVWASNAKLHGLVKFERFKK